MPRLAIALLAISLLLLSRPALCDEMSGSDDLDDVKTGLPLGPIFLGSFSAVTIAVGAGFGWQAHQAYDEWEIAQAAGDGAGMDGIAEDVRKYSITANILMFGGLTTLAISVIWGVLDAKRRRGGRVELELNTASRFTPMIGPASVGFSIRL